MSKPWEDHNFGVQAEPVFCTKCEKELDPRQPSNMCLECLVPRGFRSWVKVQLNDDPKALVAYLGECCAAGPRDSLVWPLLEATGDRIYNLETFSKAAQIVLKTEYT